MGEKKKHREEASLAKEVIEIYNHITGGHKQAMLQQHQYQQPNQQ